MPDSSRSKRVLLYSHDSFGLGHVSRCRTIANYIAAADHSLSVLILSGSPVIGSYEFRSGIDFVRIPGVVKQIDTGEYDSANLRVNVEHTLEMRTRIIRALLAVVIGAAVALSIRRLFPPHRSRS